MVEHDIKLMCIFLMQWFSG